MLLCFTSRPHKVTDATDHRIHASATAVGGRYDEQRTDRRRRRSLVADDDVAVFGSLCDHGVLAARRRRRRLVVRARPAAAVDGGGGETHEGEVDALSRLRDDHPRAGDRRADAERSRRVAGDDARLAADDRVDARVRRRRSVVVVAAVAQRTRSAAVAVAAARDVGWNHH